MANIVFLWFSNLFDSFSFHHRKRIPDGRAEREDEGSPGLAPPRGKTITRNDHLFHSIGPGEQKPPQT